jgi:hypothetical protein
MSLNMKCLAVLPVIEGHIYRRDPVFTSRFPRRAASGRYLSAFRFRYLPCAGLFLAASEIGAQRFRLALQPLGLACRRLTLYGLPRRFFRMIFRCFGHTDLIARFCECRS